MHGALNNDPGSEFWDVIFIKLNFYSFTITFLSRSYILGGKIGYDG